MDQKQAQGVLAEGPSVFGVVKTVDAGNHSITVVQGPGRGGEAGEERTLAVPRDAQVVLDDGKGRRLSLKQGKLGDVPVGASAMLKLSSTV